MEASYFHYSLEQMGGTYHLLGNSKMGHLRCQQTPCHSAEKMYCTQFFSSDQLLDPNPCKDNCLVLFQNILPL